MKSRQELPENLVSWLKVNYWLLRIVQDCLM